MQRRTLITTAAAALALAALLAWAFAPRPVPVETAQAAVGPFEQTLDEDGRTRLRERYVVSAPLTGRLARIALHEGDAVRAGDALATLTPALSPLLDERTRAELLARVQVAQAGARAAATRTEAARIAQQRARNELSRTEALARQGFVGPAKLDADLLANQAAAKELELAQDGQGIAARELEQARAALGAIGGAGGSSGGAFIVRAPVDGRVLRVLQPSEGVVALGTPLLELGDTRRLEVVAELLTADALQAVPGRAVRIERWGGPVTLAGTVRQVEPAAFTKVSALGVEEQRVRVLIDLTGPPAQWAALGDGFRVGVRIVVLQQPRALQVPVSAVFPRPAAQGGGDAVFVLQDGRARLRPVVLGARNAASAWVREGLADGDAVIVYPGAAVADGVRVAVRRP
jgi:HlyD family secretion protein